MSKLKMTQQKLFSLNLVTQFIKKKVIFSWIYASKMIIKRVSFILSLFQMVAKRD